MKDEIKCVVCGKSVNFFARKTNDGRLCRECASYIPSFVKLQEADADYLSQFVGKNKEKRDKFNVTANYGACYIDSLHGLFCISNHSKQGEPTALGDLFSIYEIQEVGLYCSDVKNIGKRDNNIICNVKIAVKIDDKMREYQIIANETCPFYTKGNSLEWQEPPRLGMFRAMFNQMIDNAIADLTRKLEAIKEMDEIVQAHGADKQWAKGVFFIDKDEEPTPELIKKRRNRLAKMFHPDLDKANVVDNTEIQTAINKAYEMLTK